MTALAQIGTRPIVYVAIYKPSKSAPKVRVFETEDDAYAWRKEIAENGREAGQTSPMTWRTNISIASPATARRSPWKTTKSNRTAAPGAYQLRR